MQSEWDEFKNQGVLAMQSDSEQGLQDIVNF